jgi:UDP-N-acetylenolpyruvoylglucosamine reductase
MAELPKVCKHVHLPLQSASDAVLERMHSGPSKGFRMGPVGISSRHALALVHHGGGATTDLLRLALHVRAAVFDRFGVVLSPEPVFLGLTWPATLD